MDAEDICGDGRLLKKIEVQGSGECPKKGDRVEVHYETRLGDVRLDASDSTAFSFVLGDGEVLDAWDIGVAGMRPGERSNFVVHHSLAYGEEGAGDIPPCATLEFTIELYPQRDKKDERQVREEREVCASKARTGKEEKEKDRFASRGSRFLRASEAKERGNQLVKVGDFQAACKAYQEALVMLEKSETEKETSEELLGLRVACFLNLSQCGLQLGDFHGAVRHASAALDLGLGAAKAAKARYRRGSAQLALGNLAEARADLAAALKAEPQNPQLRRQLSSCQQKLREVAQWHRDAFSGIFAQPSEASLPLPLPAPSHDLSLRVYLDFRLAARVRIEVALYVDTAPKTAENFRRLCTGERGSYRGTKLDRVIARHLLEVGDAQHGNGLELMGPDEGLDPHHKRGLLTASRSPTTRFIITLRSLPELDAKNVVFGEVVAGMEVLDSLEAVETQYPDAPIKPITVVACGACE